MSIYGQNLQLPYLFLVTKLRMSKRQSQNQMADILKEIVNLKNGSEQKTKQEILDYLRKSKNKLQKLGQKLKQEKIQQMSIYSGCQKKVHLDKQVSERKGQLTQQQIMNQFDKQVLHFFACRNKIKQAQTIQKSLKQNFEYGLYLQLYEKAYKISESVIKNDLRPLKDWVYEHSHYLSKIKSSLEFKLISCIFVNILNNTNVTKAIQFLRKQVAVLSLSDKDKQQVNRLTCLVLFSDQNQDVYYYSDSEAQKLRNAQLQYQQVEKQSSKQQEKQQQNNRVLSSSSSSSSNLGAALIATQQYMRQIYRALAQLTQGAQEMATIVFNSISPPAQQAPQPPQPAPLTNTNQIEGQGSESLMIMQPQPLLEGSNSGNQRNQEERQQEEEQCQYEDQFQAMSEEEEKEEGKKQDGRELEKERKQDQFIQENIQVYEEKQQNQKDKHKQNIKNNLKKSIRKHKLDKNNLRQLLQQTRKQFLQSISKIYQITFQPLLDKTLAIGISILKTHSCRQPHPPKTNPEKGYCPICTTQIQAIIQRIPGTLKNQSSLICRINGSLMNEVNYPVALPNGQIYSLEGLRVSEKNGNYYCPIEGKWFRKEVCRKVFLT